MIRRWLPLAFVVLAACDPPPLALRFTLTDGDAQKCISPDTGNETTDCADITMLCKAVLSLRIVPPKEPDFPYISLCKPLVGAQNKLCAIAGIDLPQPSRPMHEQVLEVQMAVFQSDQLEHDPDGNPICPRVDFAANNLPEPGACTDPDPANCPPRPAVGGRTFYYPGDEETVVKLGCTELELLNGQTCKGATSIDVTATVNDFDTGASVGSTTAERLTVSIGEPKSTDMGGVALSGTLPLDLRITAPPAWFATLTSFMPSASFCLEVAEDVAQATRTVTCRQVPAPPLLHIDITGVRLAQPRLTEILGALGRMTFPPEGLVVGIVLSRSNQPQAGAIVLPFAGPNPCPTSTCDIKYLSEDRMSFTGTSTASNGIWVSEKSPYGTTFGWSGQVTPAYGGLIEGKVTIVVLQESTSVGM